MKKKTVWLVVSCLMVAALVLASCGPAAEEEEKEIVTPGEEEEVAEGEVVTVGENMVTNTAGKLVERPRYGGWYRIAITSDIRGFDDALPATPNYIIPHMGLVYDELLVGDWTKGSQGTGESSWTVGSTFFAHLEAPCLATSYEMPDNETIIYHIRQGVHWQDKPPVNGREFTAHDAAYNLLRSFTTTGAFLAGTYRQDLGQGVESVTVIDDWTVEMKVAPSRQLPILHASAEFLFMHPPEMIEQYGDMSDWKNACGTGPFMLTDYVPVSSITFERNPDYWRYNPLHPEDQLPYVDGVEFYVIADTSTSLAAFRTGKLEARPGVNKDDFEALLKTNPNLLWVKWAPSGCATIYLRQDKPELPYDDIRVRKALFYATDHPGIVEDYYEGEAVMITAPISGLPEFAKMHTPFEEYSEEVQKLYGYYPEEARQLLKEAGYPDGFTCTALASSEGLLPIIKDMWAKVGVTMSIDIRQSPVVSSITMGGQHEDIYYGGLSGTNVLKWQMFRTDSYLNYSKINDARFNEQFEIINTNLNNWDKICEVSKELDPYLRAQAYFIDLPAPYSYFLWHPWLKGWGGEITIGYFNTYSQFKYLWIDTELRKEITGQE